MSKQVDMEVDYKIMYKKWKTGSLIFIVSMLILLSAACSTDNNNLQLDYERQPEKDYTNVKPEDGVKSRALSSVYTTKKQLSLTFNGLAQSENITDLLEVLDLYSIKATFFVPGMRVAEEPNLLKLITDRGHQIENNTLSSKDLTLMEYEDVYKEIDLTNDLIEQQTKRKPKFVRTNSGFYNESVLQATAQAGMENVVTYSLNLSNWDIESEQEKRAYLSRHINRGGIISINMEKFDDLLPTIKRLAEMANQINYKFVLLEELISNGNGFRKPIEQINGYDAAVYNDDISEAAYTAIASNRTGKKKISLTFDDWGTDFAITPILDILEKYNIKASFFLRANGVENNPNLASAMSEAGHEIANHTYSHPVITTLNTKQIQEEIVKAHRIITEAIQEKPAMLFRPPTGAYDEMSAKAAAATGYDLLAMYDVTTYDWDASKDAATITKIVLDETKDGSVILLHMLDDIHTIEALPKIIEQLHSKGFEFVTYSDLLADK